jgi:nucleotide-binding universal stress UspA family protein
MSYNKIISVVNEHTVSTVTARYAIAMALSCKAALVLYAAHAEGSNETVLRHLDRHLEQLFTDASALGISVIRVIEIGNISTLLPKRVEGEKADLVFFPLMPFKRYGANLARHTVHHLQRAITSDLVVMRVITMAKPHPGHILMPLGKVADDKGSRLLFITELARSFHSQVTLYHLAAESEAQGMPGDILQFGKQLQQEQITVRERISRGDIGKSITVEAITHHHDLIVLGASERGMLHSLFIGNPAGDVMQQPPCNTVLFRPAP